MAEDFRDLEQSSAIEPNGKKLSISPFPDLVWQRRWWWVGLIATLCGPVAHIYCGRLPRAVAVWVLQLVANLLALLALVQIPGDFFGWIVGVLLLLSAYVGCIIDAILLARRSSDSPRRWCQRWWFYVGAWILMVALNLQAALLFRSFVAEAFVVPARGMIDSILAGDRLIVDKLAYWRRPIRRGAVVVAMIANWDGRIVTIRVVGLPGDVISMTDERVFINGVPLDEPYAQFLPMEDVDSQLRAYPETTIPADAVFLMGDNRRRSYDSRFYGSQPVKNVLGKVSIVYWSMVLPTPDEPGRLEPGEVWDPQPAGTIRWSRIGRQVNR